jgi:tRNA dimethylallyltransferase
MPDSQSKSRLIAIMGTTASGKTELAEALADRLSAQLVNADAFQIYRHLDIGTAKSHRKAEYRLMDIRNPNETFGVGEWVRMAGELIRATKRDLVFVGGSGFYTRALFEGYDAMAPQPGSDLRLELNELTLGQLLLRLDSEAPAAAMRVDRKNRVRVQRALERELCHADPLPAVEIAGYETFKFAIDRDPAEVEQRIASRTEEMFRQGWPDEVSHIMSLGYKIDDPGLRAHGYRHIWQALEGKMEMVEASSLTTGEVRRYAKRQRTWLRKEPRLIRLQPDDPVEEALRRILN